ncbi:MAG: ABC transporter permease subunit [Opitutaceae bacterium]|jgi:oligopeptide transport system permease protein
MLRFIARRILETIPVLFIIVTGTFFMIRFVPGGPFTAEKSVPPEVQRNLDAYYHLNDPLWKQYIDYLRDLCPKRFHPTALPDFKAAFGIDLRPSFRYANRTVNEIIAEKLPVSLTLGLLSLGVALGLGLTAGVIAAVKRNTWIDYATSALAVTGICVPAFVMGPLLVLVFAIKFGWFNASGWYSPRDYVLPSLTLGFVYAAYVARLTRGGMIEVLSQDYIRTARAKGASEMRIVFRHALRGGLLPVVSFLGPAIAGILTGSFVIETIFQIPGLGREFVTSAFNRDYNLVLGTVLLYAVFVILLNLAVDVLQVWLNPKLRFE